MDKSICLILKTLWVSIVFFQLLSYQNIYAKTNQKKIEVLDGDSLVINNQDWRLWGIDAPEFSQKCVSLKDESEIECGKMAKEKLTSLIIQPINCELKDIDKYKRNIGICTNANGININAQMVSYGFAFDYRRYSDFYFKKQEEEAKTNKRGLWQTKFLWPWHYRRINPR